MPGHPGRACSAGTADDVDGDEGGSLGTDREKRICRDGRGCAGGRDRRGRRGGRPREGPARRGPAKSGARVPRHVGGERREPGLADAARPVRGPPASRAARAPRLGRGAPAEHGDLPGPPGRRRAVALAARAVERVPHRRPGPRPRLGPARHRRAGGPRTGPGAARLVQPVPGGRPRRPHPAGVLAPGPPPPRVGRAVRRQALLQPRTARGAGLRPGRDGRRGAPLRHRRRPLRRLLLPLSGGRPGLRRRRRLGTPRLGPQ